MKNIDWARKLTSRKFWAAVTTFITMIATAFGATENETVQIAALVMAGATVVAYIVGEGLADANNKNNGGGQ